MLKTKQLVLACSMAVLILSIVIVYSSQSKTPNYPEEQIFLHYFLAAGDTAKANMLYQPTTVRLDPAGNVIVLDMGNHRLMKYDMNGKLIKQIGSIGQGPGELLRPYDFDVDGEGKLYVVEDGNKRVSIFSGDGKFLNSFLIPRFPQATIFVTRKDEILLSQPTVDGGLFDVYSQDGKKIRSLCLVEPFENPPFKGPNRMATWAFNRVLVHENLKNELDVFYITRPLFRRFSADGRLLLEKAVKGAEIDTAYMYEKKNRERNPVTNPNSVVSTMFFTDFDYLSNNLMLVRLIGAVNSFYLVDTEGSVLKKYKVYKTAEIEEENPLISRFCVAKNNQVIGSDMYHGMLYQIELK
jgi:DNA-binding beta-propeller fold protein YncE